MNSPPLPGHHSWMQSLPPLPGEYPGHQKMNIPPPHIMPPPPQNQPLMIPPPPGLKNFEILDELQFFI